MPLRTALPRTAKAARENRDVIRLHGFGFDLVVFVEPDGVGGTFGRFGELGLAERGAFSRIAELAQYADHRSHRRLLKG